MLIAAAGFVINDIFDFKSDQINKPKQTFIPSLISLKAAKKLYAFLTLFGLILAIFIAFKINSLVQLVIYPLAVMMLYYYSSRFKNSVIIGNIIVSIFVCLVTGIVLFAERVEILSMTSEITRLKIFEIFISYMTFSFFINLAREIVKDIEDVDGDKEMNINTLPIKHGVEFSKKIVMSICAILILLMVLWMMNSSISLSFRVIFYLIIFIIAPLGWIIQKINIATFKSDFNRISHIFKMIMIAGLVSLILIS
jgi:4-hydroxybenzoate polyprenyltransferase